MDQNKIENLNSTGFPALPRDLSRPLLDWYDKNRRILPWREDPTPYHVWISEIMLQQTRVEAVIPYYLRFLTELPDVASLAKVPEDTLLKLWEGLGYYSRARNLKKAAGQVMLQYGGSIPSDPKELIKLSGIGPYTAAAIASIAFQVPVPSVDGNLLRVYARLTGYAESIKAPAVKKAAEQEFGKILPSDRPGDTNQAFMDLGATVCLPNGAPLCGLCPLAAECFARQNGCETSLPAAEKKAERPVENKTVLLIRKDDSVLIQKRPKGGLLAGLWEFPNLEGHLSESEVKKYCAGRGLTVRSIRPLPSSRHIFTHRIWDMIGYEVVVTGEEAFTPVETVKKEYPIPSAFSVYTKQL